MKEEREYRGCAIDPLRNGKVRFRFRWKGRRYSRTVDEQYTPETKSKLTDLAELIRRSIRLGRNPLEFFESKSSGDGNNGLTIAAYYEEWIADKVPPLVRRSRRRDYERHIKGYVLPAIGHLTIGGLRARDILGLRAELVSRGLSIKYCKNIVQGSFKAMIRDAGEIDQLLAHDPFRGVRWPRITVPGPEPFTDDERSRIEDWFREKPFGFHCGVSLQAKRLHPHPPYHAYVHFLFWTGTRPSEAAALRWGEVDLASDAVRITRSRHLGEENAPKTSQAVRTVQLMPVTVDVLRAIQPLRVDPDTHVFTNVEGRPIEPKAFSTHWYRCLRALKIRVRGLYASKDTFVSTALTAGVNTAWLEAQTGVRYETLRRHYGHYVRAEGADQIAKIAAYAAKPPRPLPLYQLRPTCRGVGA